MAQAHNIVRLDKVSGTYNGAKLYSVRVVDAKGNGIAVDNGTLVSIGGLIDGERELHKATVVDFGAADAKMVALIASSETVYDDTKDSLADFENPADGEARAYLLTTGDIFSIAYKDGDTTADKFTVGTQQTVGDVALSVIEKDSEGYDVVFEVQDKAATGA